MIEWKLISRSRSAQTLAVVLLLSLGLNLCGNSWGTPDRWHPDELDSKAAAMVSQKTLNPHFFPYGGLHYYVLAVSAALPVGIYNLAFDPKPADSATDALANWRDRKNTRVQIMARAMSALMASLIVFFTYSMGNLLFSKRVGLLAALFLAVSPLFVLIAHFATVDMAASFWYWLACLLSLLSWKRETRIAYPFAAFTAGLAVGVKLDRLVVVIPLLLAPFLAKEERKVLSRRILVCALLIPIGYIIANPTLLLSFFEFADGTTRDFVFNTLRGQGERSFLPMLVDMKSGMGAAVFGVFLASLAYLCYELVRGEKRREIGWLLSTILPLYLVFGSRFAMPWYSPFFYPAMAIVAAYGCMSVRGAVHARAAGAVGGLVVAAVGWSLLQSIVVDQQFINDARYAAARWIEANVPRGSSIEVGRRGPVLPPGMFELRRRTTIPAEYYDDAYKWRGDLAQSKLYESVHGGLLRLEKFLNGLFGLKLPEHPYEAWFDRLGPPQGTAAAESSTDVPEPEYRVLVDYLDYSLVDKYKLAGSGYRLAAQFQYKHPLHLMIAFPFINPTVYVFQRSAAPN
jgi:hypothetical protein